MTRVPQLDVLVTAATAREVPAIAALHRECLPESMISMLGPAAVERYYALLSSSPSEHVFVARSGQINRQGAADANGAKEPVSAACVLTLEPNTVMKRFVSASPLRFAADLAHRSLTRAFRKRLLARIGEGGGPPPSTVPEVTQIFTDADQRGKRLGSALLRACEDRLRELGQLTYCIHTLRDDNDAGIRFYRREGFTDSGTSRSFGDHYLVMTKGLR